MIPIRKAGSHMQQMRAAARRADSLGTHHRESERGLRTSRVATSDRHPVLAFEDSTHGQDVPGASNGADGSMPVGDSLRSEPPVTDGVRSPGPAGQFKAGSLGISAGAGGEAHSYMAGGTTPTDQGGGEGPVNAARDTSYGDGTPTPILGVARNPTPHGDGTPTGKTYTVEGDHGEAPAGAPFGGTEASTSSTGDIFDGTMGRGLQGRASVPVMVITRLRARKR